MSYTLPSLPYAYDALEPHFDKQTMEIHHTKHHQTYVNNANAALESLPEFANLPVEELITKLDQLPADKKTVLRNNAGGHANHSLFWKGLKKGTTLQGDLKAAIERDFGSVDNFKAEFEKAAASRFGSGWAWLVLAVMCGIFSAGMSFAMNAAKPMHEAAAALGVDPLYVALPSYVIIMGGGAIINLGFCFIRLAKVKDLSLKADFSLAKPLIIHNVLLSALGGLMWYLQFFFYAWGHARIPAQYDYISWMLHMSFYVLCGGIVGLVLKEWNNAGRRPVTVLSLGCVVIIVAANIVGIGMAN